MDKQQLVFIAIFFAMLSAVLITNNSMQISYFETSDIFGLLSVSPLVFAVELSLPIFLLMLLYFKRAISSVTIVLPLLLYVGIIYAGVALSNASYVTNFSDSIGHFIRGQYVIVTGHSNPQVDPYFDMQSGFFWATAILSNVCGFSISSSITPIALSIISWAPILLILLCIPILYDFYKRQLHNPLSVSLALLVTFSCMLLTFHYSAQSFGTAIFWVILSLTFFLVNRRDSKYSILLLILGLSLFFIHKGLTIMVLLIFVALIFYPLPFKILSKDKRFFSKEFMVFPITFGIAWVIYIAYFTIHQFSAVLLAIVDVFSSFRSEGASLVLSSVDRAYIPWSQFVTYKAVFILILIGMGLLFSFLNGYKKKNEFDKLSFSILLFSTIFFGGASVGLGGAGYIERLPALMMPLIVYSVIKYFSSNNFYHKIPKTKISKIFSVVLVFSLLFTTVFVGSTIHMAGQNFLSVTYGEFYSFNYMTGHSSQNIDGLYNSGIRITNIRYVVSDVLRNESADNYQFVLVQRAVILETYYNTYANMSFINHQIASMSDKLSIVYSNPDATIFLNTNVE